MWRIGTNKVVVVLCPHRGAYIIFIARTRPGRLFIAYLLHTVATMMMATELLLVFYVLFR